MDLWEFSLLLEDISPNFELVDGRIFLDREKSGLNSVVEKISKYSDMASAQYWMNMVPIDDLITGACGKWSISDPPIQKIADVYRRSWLAIIYANFGEIPDLSVDLISDEDAGDLIVALRQAAWVDHEL